MATRTKPDNITTNRNTNNNTTNVNVNVEYPQKKKTKPNWYIRAIVGGAIGIIVAWCGNYIKKNIESKSNNRSITTQPVTNPIEGRKEN